MSLKGAIFDVDGILVDTVPLHFAAWQRLFDEYGYAFDETIYRDKVDGRPRSDSIRDAMVGAGEQTIAEAAARKQAYYLELIEAAELRPFAGATALLDDLEVHGIGLAAASSSRNTRAVLDQAGLLDTFSVVVTSADIRHGKPHPEIFLTAAARLGLPPGECVVFEDAESGVQAARRGGFFCVGINRDRRLACFDEAHLVARTLGDVTVGPLRRAVEARIERGR